MSDSDLLVSTKSRFLRGDYVGVNDECHTPKILVEPIIPYIPKGAIVWCPFDRWNSEFVLTLRENGVEVTNSHIDLGDDFFHYEPRVWDIAISNPPFSKKLEVFQRLYDLDKPFAMVMNLNILNYQVVGEFFLDKPLQLLIVDKKVSYDGNTSSFNSSYFCNKMLPRDLMFTHLEHNNSRKNFVPARRMAEMMEQEGRGVYEVHQ